MKQTVEEAVVIAILVATRKEVEDRLDLTKYGDDVFSAAHCGADQIAPEYIESIARALGISAHLFNERGYWRDGKEDESGWEEEDWNDVKDNRVVGHWYHESVDGASMPCWGITECDGFYSGTKTRLEALRNGIPWTELVYGIQREPKLFLETVKSGQHCGDFWGEYYERHPLR